MVVQVCIIGAGASGMGLLASFNELKGQGCGVEVTCYEKQETPGGLWNLTWRTGLDETGEPVHCSQYRDLFSNGAKECLEFADYTFEEHFGKEIPSYPPRAVLKDYLEGYWKKSGITAEQITTRHAVRNVDYNNEDKLFTVRVADLTKKTEETRKFDYVIVATGHFSIPHIPSCPGLDKFDGRVIHAHDFRNAREFTRQRLLLVGGSYSAEDIALQCYKFGAGQVTISYRSRAMGFKWPEGIREVPLLERIEGKTCFFKDGSFTEVDAIILCTGYQMHFPFMRPEYRLECGNIYYPPNLYRGVQWYGVDEGKAHADGRLFYSGMSDQFYTFTMFMMASRWIANVIKGLHVVPSPDECVAESKKWYAENALLTDCYEEIATQTGYLARLAADIGYEEKLDTTLQFHEWEHNKMENILTYRDKSHESIHTGKMGPVHPVPWLECFDDSLEGYVNCC